MSDIPLLPSLSPAEARQIDQTCDCFEAAWKAGQRPRPEAYLGTAGEPERSTLLRQLLLLDWDYRRQAGDDPRAGDYQARFPDDTALIEDVRREMTEAADSTCVDPDGSHAPHTPWAGGPSSAVAGKATAGAEAGPARYDLLREVGHGGIGVVFRGHDRLLRREVAVKVLREDYRDSPDARHRFTEEARVGSQLQHPAIVPVYDQGWFGDGRPYLTMKLVEGHTLAALLQGRADPAQELPRLLGIFAQVCQAMAYAHARGVVHRDLKPANVMVGAFGEVQVMDWGFAKQLRRAEGGWRMENGGDSSATRTPPSPGRNQEGVTQSGALMGTPPYMPPEQARGEVALIDLRADVFALGAILCEILTGRPPYVGGTADEVCRQAAAGDLQNAYARLDACGADAAPRELARRCLAADRAARPPEAGVVAEELTAYLVSAQERLRQAQLERAAAEARAQEAAAKAKAEWRARRLTLALAAAALLLILGAAAAPVVGLVLLRAEQQQTEKERRAAVAAREDEARRRQQARQALDLLAGPVIKDWLGNQPAVSQEQKKYLEQALAIYTAFAAETGADEASRAGLARACFWVGTIQRHLGRLAEAEEAYDRGATIYTRLTAESPGRLAYRKGLADVLYDRAVIWNLTGRTRQAEAALRDLVTLKRQLAAESADPADRLELAWTLNDLGQECHRKGQFREAEALAREAVTILQQCAAEAPDHAFVQYSLAKALRSLGRVLASTERLADAERTYRDALKLLEPWAAANPNHSGFRELLGSTFLDLAFALLWTKGPRDAEAAAQEALKIYQQLSDTFPAYPSYRTGLASSHYHLGILLAELGRHGEAVQAYRNAIRLNAKLAAELPKVPGYRFELARSHFRLGGLLRTMNRPREAEAADREALRLFRALAAADQESDVYRHFLAGSLVNFSWWHQRRGESAEAQRMLEEALPHHRTAIHAKPRSREYRTFLCTNRINLARLFLVKGQHAGVAEAVGQLAEAAQAAAAETGATFPVDLMWGAAYLARCASLVEKDAQLPDDRRAELARSYAERAVATLRLALEHGYRDAAKLKTDSHFASLLSRPDFQELVAGLEKGQKLP
jgi:tetratricopeptide (TPR) repeat protein/tRNA A-37 threonylcarbamoyl transferase component Bud32